jgi:hypothetical protein
LDRPQYSFVTHSGTISAIGVSTSDWILATVETVVVGGDLVVIKLFRRGDGDEAPTLPVPDVLGRGLPLRVLLLDLHSRRGFAGDINA